jgi:hypothetical protein
MTSWANRMSHRIVQLQFQLHSDRLLALAGAVYQSILFH